MIIYSFALVHFESALFPKEQKKAKRKFFFSATFTTIMPNNKAIKNSIKAMTPACILLYNYYIILHSNTCVDGGGTYFPFSCHKLAALSATILPFLS